MPKVLQRLLRVGYAAVGATGAVVAAEVYGIFRHLVTFWVSCVKPFAVLQGATHAASAAVSAKGPMWVFSKRPSASTSTV